MTESDSAANPYAAPVVQHDDAHRVLRTPWLLVFFMTPYVVFAGILIFSGSSADRQFGFGMLVLSVFIAVGAALCRLRQSSPHWIILIATGFQSLMFLNMIWNHGLPTGNGFLIMVTILGVMSGLGLYYFIKDSRR